MGRSTAATRWRIAAVVVGGLIAACKHAKEGPGTSEPSVSDDIAAIEAQLERNADDLEAAGIYVARAHEGGPGFVQQQPPTPDEAEPGDAEEPPQASADEDDVALGARDGGASRERESKRSRIGYWSRWLSKRERKKDEAQRCQRICDLAESTCELADRICELAQRHPDEVRYETACSRAEQQCRVAAEACTVCVE